MAATLVRAWVTVVLLMCVLGSEALDLLKATSAATSGDLPAPPSVHCWCPSYPNVTLCSWPHSPLVHYIATYSERHQQSDNNSCLLITPNSSFSALNAAPSSDSHQFWHCRLPNLKLLTDYIINITAVHSGGSSSHLTSFMMEDIVKPDPPVNLRVSPLNNKKLLVEWSSPITWTSLDIFPLKYQILYKWENRGTPHFVNLGPFESTQVELKGLFPGRTYHFQVCAKELLGLGQCSNWSSPVQITIPKTKP